MKVRITKVPDKSLNARKWKHGDGGFLQQYPDKNIFRGGGSGGAEGGKKYNGINDFLQQKAAKWWYNKHVMPAVEQLGMDEVRKRLYDNISPVGYHFAKERIKAALNNENFEGGFDPIGYLRDDIWRTYLMIPESDRHKAASRVYVRPSRFKPTVNSEDDEYYRLEGLFSSDKDYLVQQGIGDYPNNSRYNPEVPKIGESVQSRALGDYLGTHTLSRGVDPINGEYVSYYDLWDVAPTGGGNLSDQSQGIGKPIKFYDRIYLDDYYGVDSRPEAGSYYGGYIQPSYIKAYPDGGRIKGKRNGKFYVTELNDRREKKFQDWYANAAATLGLDPNPDAYEQAYDYRGYWLNNRDADVSSPDFHFPDTWKQPHHPTFSDESIYAKGRDGVGHWEGETFVPGDFNRLMQATEPASAVPAAPTSYGSNYVPSDDILQYIKDTEAFRDQWYQDGNGVWTIGYGFTGDDVRKRYPNGMTRAEADQYFADSVKTRIPMFVGATPNFDRLNQNQRDALFSYYYNIGHGGYTRKSPAMQEALKNFDLDTVVNNIDFGYNDRKNRGLRKRRDYERKLFGTPMDYGGILNRLRNVYGDNESVKAAILRAKNVKK